MLIITGKNSKIAVIVRQKPRRYTNVTDSSMARLERVAKALCPHVMRNAAHGTTFWSTPPESRPVPPPKPEPVPEPEEEEEEELIRVDVDHDVPAYEYWRAMRRRFIRL